MPISGKRFMVAVSAIILGLILASPVQAGTHQVAVPASGWDNLGGQNSSATWARLGQRLVADDWQVVSLGFRVCRVGNPQGNITFSIRDSATDEIIVSKVWGDASALADQGCSGYTEVTFGSPVMVDGDVRFCIEFYGGNTTDYCQVGYFSGDRITGQYYTNYANYSTDVEGWHDIGEAEEAAYCCVYQAEDVMPPDGDGADSGSGILTPLWVVIIASGVVCVTGIVYLSRDKKRRT
jgi:hypothetical protein